MVDHADFGSEPQRVVERGDQDQRRKSNSFGDARGGGQKNQRRGRHTQRRAVMFGDVVRGESGLVVHLYQFQTAIEGFRNRLVLPVDVINHSEFDLHRLCPSEPWRIARPAGSVWSAETVPLRETVGKWRV